MSNLPILYFTIGALVGLPWGYHSARIWYEEVKPILTATFGVWAAYSAVSSEMDDLFEKCKAAGMGSEAVA